MPPLRRKGKMKEEVHTSTSAEIPGQTGDPGALPKESVVTAPAIDSATTSPTFQNLGKAPPRKVLRLKCPTCNEYPDGFRSEHELRRHTNRVHRKARKVWITIDTSPDKTFLANCKACQTGKRYNECYNAASHLRRMHFHPHKRGERKMSAAEARRGGKPGDLDPPMDVLKANWLREIDEVVGEAEDSPEEGEMDVSSNQLRRATTQADEKAPPTPTTPSTRMAIDSIVDKMDAS